MPLVKPANRNFSQNSILRKLFCRLFLPVFGLIIFFSVLFKQASDRVVTVKNSSGEYLREDKNGELHSITEFSKSVSLAEQITKLKPSQESYDEWCQARDYVDLSKDPVFAKFDNWIDQFRW